MKMTIIITIFTMSLALSQSSDIELGKVSWLRDLKKAQSVSREQKKPILILFQEVPGCGTCKNYGSNVLSHPLIVEAIETYFVPLCIYNNKTGKDAEVLKYFSEPSWNNPVVRIVDNNLNPIVDRLHDNYSSYGLVSKINTSLIKLGNNIPIYLSLLETELKAHQTGIEHVTIGMYCFWTGEKTYGALKGVVSTNAGFMNGSEVVEILYNPKETNLNELLNTGKKNKSADKIFTENTSINSINIPIEKSGTFKVDPENKYYIYKSDYKFIPMTQIQSARANSLLAEGKSCESVLSPRQILKYEQLKTIPKSSLKNNIGRDIIQAWYE